MADKGAQKMERLTQKDKQGRWVYASSHTEYKCEYNDEGEIIDMYEEPYWTTQYGPAIDRLAYYEDMFYTTLNDTGISIAKPSSELMVSTKLSPDEKYDLTLDILKAIERR